MPARGRVAGVVEEDDAEVAAGLGLDDEAAVHVRVATRLVDEQRANVVEPLGRVPARARESSAPRGGSTPPVTIRNGSPPVW